MRKRQRKLIGTVAILAFVMIYAPVAMALADSKISQAPHLLQTLAYLVLGVAWVLPLMPLIKWMEKPDPEPLP